MQRYTMKTHKKIPG